MTQFRKIFLLTSLHNVASESDGQILKNFQGMGISHMVSVFRIFHYKTFHKMNLARLIPILAVATCQLDEFDPFTECP